MLGRTTVEGHLNQRMSRSTLVTRLKCLQKRTLKSRQGTKCTTISRTLCNNHAKGGCFGAIKGLNIVWWKFFTLIG